MFQCYVLYIWAVNFIVTRKIYMICFPPKRKDSALVISIRFVHLNEREKIPSEEKWPPYIISQNCLSLVVWSRIRDKRFPSIVSDGKYQHKNVIYSADHPGLDGGKWGYHSEIHVHRWLVTGLNSPAPPLLWIARMPRPITDSSNDDLMGPAS